MPRRTRWILTSVVLALAATVLVSGNSAAATAPTGERGVWQVRSLGPGQYAVAWTSPTRLPLTSDRPTVVVPAGWSVGTSTVASDGRTSAGAGRRLRPAGPRAPGRGALRTPARRR